MIVFSWAIIMTYYNVFPFHQESFDGYAWYAIVMLICYISYKLYTLFIQKEQIQFSIFWLIMIGLGHLFVLCCIFFSLSGYPASAWVVLFFKIITYLLLPTFLAIFSYSVGLKLIKSLSIFDKVWWYTRWVTGLLLGFTFLITFLSIFSFLGFYNLTVFGALIIVGIMLSYREALNLMSNIFEPTIVLKNHDFSQWSSITNKINPYLLSTEFLFLLLTFLVSINFISIVRPMPIGWDDLGAYMNMPNLIAQAGSSLFLWAFNAWQVFTGIGFLFSSNTQAFFLNNVWTFTSILFLFFMTHDFLKHNKKQTLINIPLLVPTLFMLMPMVIFQQAKDMKLDIALFGFTVGTVYLLYKILKYISSDEKMSRNDVISYFGLLGLFLGFLFTIKFTGILTLIAVLWVVCFFFFNIAWCIGFLSGVFGVFTLTGLWSKFNVIAPTWSEGILVWSIFIIISLFCFGYSCKFLDKKNLKRSAYSIVSIFLWFIIAIFPWWVKNIYQWYIQDKPFSISTILFGASQRADIDVKNLYTLEEVNTIEQKKQAEDGLKSDGVNKNEDYGRYFWYETGINNYVKLPYNITMQVNQSGEFTEISYLFLVLLPLSLLFLPYKKLYVYIPLGILMLSSLWFLLYPTLWLALTSILSSFHLPQWYVVIFFIIFLPLLLLLGVIKDCNKWQIIKLNIAFTAIYFFFWVISAYWVVWYGIGMFAWFLLTIAFSLYYISGYKPGENNIHQWVWTWVMSVVIGIYVFASVIPHGFNNIVSAGFTDYKNGHLSQVRSIFTYQERYLKTLTELNLWENKWTVISEIVNTSDQNLIHLLSQTQVDITNIVALNTILNQVIASSDPNIIPMRGAAMSLQERLFSSVLYPHDDVKNTDFIYRVGTFLSFFISENMTRFYSDGLLNKYDSYIYDQNSDIALDRLEELWIKYILLDLNTATIDNDPRRALVKRYEKTLSQLSNDRLELVDTDSLCLKLAHEDYKNGLQDSFMTYAGVNYGSTQEKTEKIFNCYQRILDLHTNEKITKESYSFLLSLSHYINSNKDSFDTPEKVSYMLQKLVSHGYFALYKMK